MGRVRVGLDMFFDMDSIQRSNSVDVRVRVRVRGRARVRTG